MSKHLHHPTTKLLPYKQYWTFQGFYRVRSKDQDITSEDVFLKCILHVAQWLKDRTDYSAPGSEISFLAYYPPVDEYRIFGEYLFGNDSTISQRAKRDYDIGIFASKEENTWAVRVIEPDNAKETGDYPDRVFITNIAIKYYEDEVYVAIRTTCKEPSNNESEAAAFRPACLYYIYEDDSLEMYEGGIKGYEYPISGDVIRLKSHSNTASVSEKTSFRAEPHGFKESSKAYPAYYVDINENGYRDNGHLLDLHLKYSSQSRETFRIYFSYIPEIGKAIVGSMPDHLCQNSSDSRNRRNKA